MAEQTWWTSPLEDDNGFTILVTGRGDIDKFRNNPKYSIRVEISMPYDHKPDGMPTTEGAQLLENMLEPLRETFDKDPVAVITGIYTGAGIRTIVFYTLSVNIFNKKLNQALAHLPLLPLEIISENDPEWAEYAEMCDESILFS